MFRIPEIYHFSLSGTASSAARKHYYRRGRNFSAPGSSQILPRTCRKPAAASASWGRLPKLQGVWDVRL
eukprot:351302-Chlamydomonas_euryale.AAC.1